jgi:hypothetical protein
MKCKLQYRKTMKQKGYLLLLLLAFACNVVAAQPREKYERIHAIKVGYLTDKLHLTSDQAAKFWPVYNQYEDEQRGLRQKFLMGNKDKQQGMNREDAMKFVEDNLDFQEAELKLKRKYKEELLKTITAQQLAELYQSERDFKKMLIQQLRDRRIGNQPKKQ